MNGRHRGWADRLALHVAQSQGEPLLYANLAVRGRKTRHLVEEQLQPALSMRPDLATVFSGTNDIIRSNFNVEQVMADMRTLHVALRGIGATVLTITMPDLGEVAPFAKRARPRLRAFNEGVRALCAETGTLLLDVDRFPVAADPRLWHEDRLHANAQGHARIAAGLASLLGLPNFDDGWAMPLEPRPDVRIAARALAEVRWVSAYLAPWLVRRVFGRSSGDGVVAKRPELSPIGP